MAAAKYLTWQPQPHWRLTNLQRCPGTSSSVSAGAQPGRSHKIRGELEQKYFILLQKIFMIGDASTESQNTKDHVDVVCVVPVTPSFEMRRGFATRHSWFVLKIKYEVVLVGGNRAQADTSPPHRRNQEWNFLKNLESKILGVSIWSSGTGGTGLVLIWAGLGLEPETIDMKLDAPI